VGTLGSAISIISSPSISHTQRRLWLAPGQAHNWCGEWSWLVAMPRVHMPSWSGRDNQVPSLPSPPRDPFRCVARR
jgi:hypothetical protein